ncbi:MAG TPA: serine hydrolase domain-containing protein [Terriglobales bacterium]|nr:serine hydrolase domain-containing protein [Terriglobales bacterium]
MWRSNSEILALMGQHRVPGLAAARFAGGKPQDFAYYGAAQEDHLFEAASLTKPVFALSLIRSGLFELDRPVCAYSDEVISEDPRVSRITPRMLLSHSGGFENWAKKPLTLHFDPGCGFQYSGEGYHWLQRACPVPLDELCRTYVLEPFGMEDARMGWTPDMAPRIPAAVDKEGVEQPKRSKPVLNAAYSMHTTLADYAKFLAGLFAAPEYPLMKKPQSRLNEDIEWGLGLGLFDGLVWHWGDNGCFKALFALDEAGDGALLFTNGEGGLHVCCELMEEATGRPLAPIRKYIITD